LILAFFVLTLGIFTTCGNNNLKKIKHRNNKQTAIKTDCFVDCRQVIPSSFVVFCNQSKFCHPSGSYATGVKKNNNNRNQLLISATSILIQQYNAILLHGSFVKKEEE